MSIVYKLNDKSYGNNFINFRTDLEKLLLTKQVVMSIPTLPGLIFPTKVDYFKNKYDITIERIIEEDTPKPEPTPEELLEQAKTKKINEIQNHSNMLIRELKSGYTDGEVSTFEQQYQGATDLLNDNATSTNAIFVLGLLSGRLGKEPTSEEITAFAELIVNNYMTAATATGNILGKQQNLEIQVRNATTVEEVEAIVWEDEETE